jgi:hypothetical protein
VPQHLQRIGAVEYRGFIKLARNGENELPQQKDEEDVRAKPVREHQRPVRIDEMKAGPEQKRRNERGDERKHESQKQDVDFGFNVRLGEFENSKPYGK